MTNYVAAAIKYSKQATLISTGYSPPSIPIYSAGYIDSSAFIDGSAGDTSTGIASDAGKSLIVYIDMGAAFAASGAGVNIYQIDVTFSGGAANFELCMSDNGTNWGAYPISVFSGSNFITSISFAGGNGSTSISNTRYYALVVSPSSGQMINVTDIRISIGGASPGIVTNPPVPPSPTLLIVSQVY